jgi:hypothetical protein
MTVIIGIDPHKASLWVPRMPSEGLTLPVRIRG